MAPRTILGLDLGRPYEFTALAAVQESGQDATGRTVWALPLLNRWSLGTPYPEIVASEEVSHFGLGEAQLTAMQGT